MTLQWTCPHRGRRLFCDMDGVMADFNTHYFNTFGLRTDITSDNTDWKLVRSVPHFFRGIPPMRDAGLLWTAIEGLSPTILSGIPSSMVGRADNDKAEWVRERIGEDTPAIFCPSKDKCLHMRPGDVIIDDWNKHRDAWLNKGGVWITHTDALSTIRSLLNTGLVEYAPLHIVRDRLTHELSRRQTFGDLWHDEDIRGNPWANDGWSVKRS